MNEHLRFLLVLFLGVVALLVGRETYRWFRYADERNALLAMEPVIRQAGAEAVATRTETDSLRARVDSLNRDLDRRGEGLRRYGRIAVNGLLPPDVYQRYAADRREYERVLALREERYAAWKNAYDRKLCRLAFLAPSIQRAILEGRQPTNLTLDRLLQPFPPCWREQRRRLGFAPANP